MRLLHTASLKLENVSSDDPPPYAILSHTWGAPEDEILFQDMAMGPQQAALKASFIKVKFVCDQARDDGLEYCWIDTCCIDKSSSAELQEALNSMFRWYQRSEVCYAYLSDVVNSRWFTRGWTLQELIAPKHVVFFTGGWKKIGTKYTLTAILQRITGIDSDALSDSRHIHERSIAQRMSWASQRETSRSEDMAYCLMGIFAVNMPMLYGEGTQAFHRLQEEIMKISNDMSILAWRRDFELTPSYSHVPLAKSPRDFKMSAMVRPSHLLLQSQRELQESLCNGLELPHGNRVVGVEVEVRNERPPPTELPGDSFVRPRCRTETNPC
ncbi:HET-domain-containing protein [Rhizodiscina lignyota]|uniref:HET-domain-containing protein n=1 Tax=Rhizodiscina lignyota TaxID=1504668 RepID=A0A9P4IFT7_9PEZI|nr:HET-domain-containing protein [Rhizodiscina lignyota]